MLLAQALLSSASELKGAVRMAYRYARGRFCM